MHRIMDHVMLVTGGRVLSTNITTDALRGEPCGAHVIFVNEDGSLALSPLFDKDRDYTIDTDVSHCVHGYEVGNYLEIDEVYATSTVV